MLHNGFWCIRWAHFATDTLLLHHKYTDTCISSYLDFVYNLSSTDASQASIMLKFLSIYNVWSGWYQTQIQRECRMLIFIYYLEIVKIKKKNTLIKTATKIHCSSDLTLPFSKFSSPQQSLHPLAWSLLATELELQVDLQWLSTKMKQNIYQKQPQEGKY